MALTCYAGTRLQLLSTQQGLDEKTQTPARVLEVQPSARRYRRDTGHPANMAAVSTKPQPWLRGRQCHASKSISPRKVYPLSPVLDDAQSHIAKAQSCAVVVNKKVQEH